MYRQTTAPTLKRQPFRLLCLGLLALGLTTAVFAQVGNQPLNVTPDVPTYSRAMLKLRVETPTLMTLGSGTSTTYLIQPAGRFQIQTATQSPDGGNPTRNGDENRLIGSVATPYATAAWGYEYSSKITIAIDPDPTDLTEGVFQDPHALAALRSTATSAAALLDFWILPPTAGARDVAGTFRVPVDDVTTSSTHEEWITGRQVQTVIGDMVQIEYILTNESTQTHNVGLRIFIDGTFGSASAYDGRAIVLPDGTALTSEKTLPSADVNGNVLPASWVSYDSADNPNVVLRGIVDATEVYNPGIASQAAGRPDGVSWGQYRSIGATNQFYFRPNAQASLISEDWGYAVTWNAKALAPGESRRYVTYYGMGASSSDYDSPYALMAYSPFSLKSKDGDDPATPDITEQYYLTDESGRSPFPVSVYMDNFSSSAIYDASVRIRLPVGLELAPGESLTKSAGIIQRNEIKSVTWNVLATAARPGPAEIKFTGPRGKVVTRKINIPAVPVLNPLPNAANGLEMVSVPYEFSNNDAEWVFQSLGSLLPGGPASLIMYNPTGAQYVWFPDPPATTVTPGVGFWLLNRNRLPVVLPPDATPVDNGRVYNIDLKAGWNQIGNPFTSSIRMDQVRVAGNNGGEWSLDEAVSRNLLLPTIFAYDPAANQYTWELLPSESFLNPFSGYWILAIQDCTLLVPPPSLYSPASAKPLVIKTQPQAAAGSNWKIDIRVATSGASATTQSLAVRPSAAKGLDACDVAQPPPALRNQAVYLNSAFYPGASAVGMPYLLDARAPVQGQQEWNLVIRTNAVNSDVNVTWPSLEALPAGLVATLVDDATGERRYMRTTNSYVIRTGSAPTERVLKIVVQPRPAQGLAITSLQSAPSGQGGASLTFTLSADASVDVRIRNIAGAVVSEVARGQLSTAGRNTLLWNGRSTRGSYVPAGRYLCEISARSPLTGQSMSLVAPLEVKR